MAERRRWNQPTVHLGCAFDRLLDAKLQNAYAILVPDRAHKIPVRVQDIGDDHENRSSLRAGIWRPAEGSRSV